MKNSKPLPPKRTISHTIGCNNQPQKDKAITDTSSPDPICDICVQNVPGPEREKIFALGRCDHYVCYVCSARLRAICDQQDCPICREKLDCVIFCANKNRSFEKHDTKSYIYDEKYKIYFENEIIKEAFVKLLKFECLECLKKDSSKQTKNSDHDTTAKVFPDVSKLKSHLSYMHKLKLCDLCLKHNKLFPFEYSYYDSVSLSEHMRKGEPKTSHRGHPTCSLCHDTFFNQEDLLQHMSRQHFHCHLCGRHNSNMHIYFLDYASLRDHFKSKHFLCERENCKHEQFTSAFDTQIDYQLHVAQVHGGSNLSRGEARQQRTITLDSAPHRAPVERREARLPPNAAIVSTGTPATANSTDPRRQIPESMQQQIRQQRLPARSEFPALGLTSSSGSNPVMCSTSQVVTVSMSQNTNQFPSLPQATPNQQSRLLNHRIISGPSSSRGSFVRSAGGGNCAPERLDEMDFPPLPEQPKPKGARSKAKKSGPNARDENLTLDQLINSSLTISARNQNKQRSNKSTKTAKPKALKIQL